MQPVIHIGSYILDIRRKNKTTNNRKAYAPEKVFNRKIVRSMIRAAMKRQGIQKPNKAMKKIYYHEVKIPRMKKGVWMYARGSKTKRYGFNAVGDDK